MPNGGLDKMAFLGRVCNWLGKHRHAIVDHFEAKAPASAPQPIW
jgi:hypothetical protein